MNICEHGLPKMLLTVRMSTTLPQKVQDIPKQNAVFLENKLDYY